MNFAAGQSKDQGILILDAELTLNNVNDIKKELESAIKKVPHLAVDVQETREADLAFLQLMCSAHRTAVSEGKTIAFAGDLPVVIRKTIDENGFTRRIGCALNPNESCLWVIGRGKNG